MRKSFVVVSAVVALLLVFFFVPLLHYQSSGYQVAGGTYDRWEASVSASYSILGCGAAYGMNLTTLVVGNGSWTYSKEFAWPVLLCFSQPTQVLGYAGPYSSSATTTSTEICTPAITVTQGSQTETTTLCHEMSTKTGG
jgi:hypothetical protein